MIVTLLLVSQAPALAQVNYDVEADQLEIFNKEGRAVFQGNVRVWNDTSEIMANRLEVFYVEGGDTIDHLEAFGNVRLNRGDIHARSNYAYHSVVNDTAVLQEEAYVRRNRSEFWAGEIWINLRTEQIRLEQNVRGKLIRSRTSGELGS